MAQAPVRFTRLPSSSVLKDCLITGNANNLQAPVSDPARWWQFETRRIGDRRSVRQRQPRNLRLQFRATRSLVHPVHRHDDDHAK